MNGTVLIAVVGAVATLGAGAGVWSLFTVGATKRKLLAEAESSTASTAAALNRSALELMEPFRQRVHELEAEARQARQETAAARQEAAEAKEEIADLRATVADLTALMRAWRAAILDPSADVDRLRVMVTRSDRNGR